MAKAQQVDDSQAMDAAKAAIFATPDRLMYHVWNMIEGREEITWPDHQMFIGEYVAPVLEGNKNYIIQAPVRHGKSWLLSLWLPIWYLANNPTHAVAIGSYGASFSLKWSYWIREIIREHGDYLGLHVKEGAGDVKSWQLVEGGSLHSSGAQGQWTGRGFQLILMDDAVKDEEEANSQVMRDKIWATWQTTISSRLEPNGSKVVTMARWHTDDLVGRLLKEQKEGGEKWDVVSLPAIAKKNDPMGRKEGEALWPQRWPTEVLVGKDGKSGWKRARGPRGWAALCQQEPTDDESGKFQRSYFRYATRVAPTLDDDGAELSPGHYVLKDPHLEKPRKVSERDCWRIIVMDTALTEKTMNDYTVAQVWDVLRWQLEDGSPIGGDMVLVDQWRAHATAMETENTVLTMMDRYKPIWIGIEDWAGSKHLIQRLRMRKLPIRTIKADKDKVTRATEAEIAMSAGQVWFLSGAHYLFDLEDELVRFPLGEHDDQVDALAYACVYCGRRDLWQRPAKPQLAPKSYGRLLGHEQILAQDSTDNKTFALD